MLFNLLQSGPVYAIAFIVAIALGISVHEFGHALAGYLMGDMTAKDEGRLTLNPLAHLDPMGSIMLLLAGFGWGKPTPYNPYNLKYQKWGPAIISIAGPLSNLSVLVLSVIAVKILYPILGEANFLIIFLGVLLAINLMLMIFNLIPIPPLDGAQLLFTFLPPRFDQFKQFLLQNGMMLLFGLILLDNFTNINIFSRIFEFFFSLLGRIV